jgi:hypothetical protein
MSLDDVFTHEGTSRTVREWAEAIGIPRKTFYRRLRSHMAGKMSLERLFTPRLLPRALNLGARAIPRLSAGDIQAALVSCHGSVTATASLLGYHVGYLRSLLVRHSLRKTADRLRSAKKRGPSVYSAPAARTDGALCLYASSVPAGLVL